MPDADDTAAATETWHRHPVHLNRPALCLCEDDLHRNQHVMLLPSVEIRDAILRLRDEARELADVKFQRDFNMQQWSACTTALKENMATIHRLEDEAREAQQLRSLLDVAGGLLAVHAVNCDACRDFWHSDYAAYVDGYVDQWGFRHSVATGANEARDEAREAQQLRYDLRNLLAVIHRDGGHYFTDHGQEKAVKDAHLVWAELRKQVELLPEALAALQKMTDYVKAWHPPTCDECLVDTDIKEADALIARLQAATGGAP